MGPVSPALAGGFFTTEPPGKPGLHIASAKARRRRWHPTPVFSPGKSHGQRSLVGCNPWGRKESDMTEWLHFHFSLSCTGEGNGNPLQCPCLENPRDRGAWWLPSLGSQRVGHDWSDSAAAAAVQRPHASDVLSTPSFSAVSLSFAYPWE